MVPFNCNGTATLNATDFQFVCDVVRQRSAIVLDGEKAYLADSRLTPVARSLGYPSADEFILDARRSRSPRLIQSMVEAMTTNETSFFRDAHPFEILRTHVLPSLINRRSGERRLAIWSNACSSGQEIYSIAIILEEHFPELRDWNVRLIASDLSTRVLNQAREGLYNQTEINRGVPPTMLTKYFQRRGQHWQVSEHLRRKVEFRSLNLIEPFPMLPAMDVVFLRNVLIYFSMETKRDILRRVDAVMSEDGFLFFGGGESMVNLNTRFTPLRTNSGIVYTRRPDCGNPLGRPGG